MAISLETFLRVVLPQLRPAIGAGALLVAGGRGSVVRKAAFYGASAGVLFGLSAALSKPTVEILGDSGVAAVLENWELYAFAAAGILAFVASYAAALLGHAVAIESDAKLFGRELMAELAVQFARQGVRVNALCPGPVETPLLLNIYGSNPEAYERRRIHWPMGRLGKPRELVNAALFLASDESSFVNAATFVVDGGITAAYVTPE